MLFLTSFVLNDAEISGMKGKVFHFVLIIPHKVILYFTRSHC